MANVILPDVMQEAALNRAAKYTPSVVKVLPSPTSILSTGELWLGSYSLTLAADAKRYVKEDHAVNLFGVPQTPGEVARDYLGAIFDKRRRITSAQLTAVKEHRAQPMYSNPGFYRDMAYVDLTAAYWSLLNLFGWDVDYNPGRWVRSGRAVTDFPLPSNKVSRNALVMIGISNGMRVYREGKLFTRNTGTRFANFSLWAAIQDSLHSIAWRAMALGAVYINTDGYIVPEANMDKLIDWIEALGLAARVKHTGDCTVWSVGKYTIGGHVSKLPVYNQRYTLGLNPHWRESVWMLRRIEKLASYRAVTSAGEGDNASGE